MSDYEKTSTDKSKEARNDWSDEIAKLQKEFLEELMTVKKKKQALLKAKES